MTQICLFTHIEAVKQGKLEYSHTHLQTAPIPRWQNVLDFTARQARRRKGKLQSEMEGAGEDVELEMQKNSLILNEVFLKNTATVTITLELLNYPPDLALFYHHERILSQCVRHFLLLWFAL